MNTFQNFDTNIINKFQKTTTMKKLTHIVLFFTTILLLSSCAMNEKFVNPFPFPAMAKAATIMRGTPDSTKVYFNGTGHEPTFVRLRDKDTLYKDIQFTGVFFNNNNGERLHGYILKSRQAKSLNINIVHFRGAANNLVINQFQAIEPLVRQGFTVLVFDYAGFGFSQGHAIRKDLLDDGQSAITYMKSISESNTKLIAYGQSFGGNLAVAVAAKVQDKLDALVTEGAFASHKDMAAVDSGLGGRIFVKELYSAKRTVDNFKKPILIIHSIEDETVPFSMAKKIYSCANQPKVLLEIKGKHLDGPTNSAELITEKIKEILK